MTFFSDSIKKAAKHNCLTANNLSYWARLDPKLPPPLSKSPISGGSDAKSDAHSAPKATHNRNLAKVIEAWPKISQELQAAILAKTKTQVEGEK